MLSDSFNNLHGAAADEADGAFPPADDIDVIKDLASGGAPTRAGDDADLPRHRPRRQLVVLYRFSTASRTSPMAQLTAMTQYLTELAHNAGAVTAQSIVGSIEPFGYHLS